MKILITGANGLLGQKLVSLISSNKSNSLIATAKGANRNPPSDAYIYEPMDVTKADDINRVFALHRPEAVIHTAAMTNVDQCESDKEGCDMLNVTAVSLLIAACQGFDAFLVHVSTDFIFDGQDGPYDEDAFPNPISYYGESKWKAEQLIQSSGIPHAIARTVLVYGVAHDMSRSNIILWVKKSLEEKKDIQVVNDQWRTPTLAEDLAAGCYLLAVKKITGIFNISGEELLTPYDMALKTAKYFGLDQKYIHETDGSKFTQPAKRPPRTGFVIDKAKEKLGYNPRSFEEGLKILDSQLN